MKTKLEMAHEYLLRFSGTTVADAWQYADAMQAEADKREKEEAAQRRKEIREMLNAPNTFVERDGQHFDDFCSDEIQAQRDAELYGTGFLKVTYDSDGVKYERLDPKTISVCSSNIGLDSQVLEKWQPDWSQAPDNLVKYFAVDENGRGGWFISKPTLCIDHWYWSDFEERVDNDHYDYAPSFGYTGDWRNSLRKRPQ